MLDEASADERDYLQEEITTQKAKLETFCRLNS